MAAGAWGTVCVGLAICAAASLGPAADGSGGTMEAAKPHPAKHRPEGTVCALFGLPTDKEPLADKTPEELAERLVADGINAVVHVPHKLELIKALKAAGIA